MELKKEAKKYLDEHPNFSTGVLLFRDDVIELMAKFAESQKEGNTDELPIQHVMTRFKVNGIINGHEIWVLTDDLKTAKKVKEEAINHAIDSDIYQYTEDGWLNVS